MTHDLVIPTYIDTNSLLDLLATIADGFSIVEKYSSKESSVSDTSIHGELSGGTEFGIPNILNLLKLSTKFSGSAQKEQEKVLERESERYYTYGALLHKLRKEISSQVKRIDAKSDWDQLRSGDFIEIQGFFQPNPLVHSLNTLNKLIDMMKLLTNISQISQKEKKGQKQSANKELRKQRQDMENIQKFFGELLKDMNSESVRTFIVNIEQPFPFQAVVLLYLEYLRDKTMSEIIFKEYRMLGKVVRKVDSEDDSPIDLLMGYALRGFNDEILEQFLDVFSNTPELNLPKVKTKIPAPALEIVPIAIYV